MKQIIVDAPIDVELHYTVRVQKTAPAAPVEATAPIASVPLWLKEMQRFTFNLPSDEWMARHEPANMVPGDD